MPGFRVINRNLFFMLASLVSAFGGCFRGGRNRFWRCCSSQWKVKGKEGVSTGKMMAAGIFGGDQPNVFEKHICKLAVSPLAAGWWFQHVSTHLKNLN